jgi:hypothetical protein
MGLFSTVPSEVLANVQLMERHLAHDYNSTEPTSDFFNSGTPGSSQAPTTESHGMATVEERSAFEFVAFLLWYMFLVICCVLPTCLAYRRRRLAESRLVQQQATFDRLRQQNFFVISDFQDAEAIKAERTRKIVEELRATTFVRSVSNSLVCVEDEAVRNLLYALRASHDISFSFVRFLCTDGSFLGYFRKY